MLTLFTNFMNYLKGFKKNQKGQAMVEYALIIGLVAVVLIGALVLLQGGIGKVFSDITTKLNPPS